MRKQEFGDFPVMVIDALHDPQDKTEEVSFNGCATVLLTAMASSIVKSSGGGVGTKTLKYALSELENMEQDKLQQWSDNKAFRASLLGLIPAVITLGPLGMAAGAAAGAAVAALSLADNNVASLAKRFIASSSEFLTNAASAASSGLLTSAASIAPQGTEQIANAAANIMSWWQGQQKPAQANADPSSNK